MQQRGEKCDDEEEGSVGGGEDSGRLFKKISNKFNFKNWKYQKYQNIENIKNISDIKILTLREEIKRQNRKVAHSETMMIIRT